jgi:hypothetical protein
VAQHQGATKHLVEQLKCFSSKSVHWYLVFPRRIVDIVLRR